MGKDMEIYDLSDLYKVYGLLQNLMDTFGYEVYAEEGDAHIIVRKDRELYLSDIQRIVEWYGMPEDIELVEIKYGNESTLGIKVYCQKPFVYLDKDFGE